MERGHAIEQALGAIREAITVNYERDYFDLHQGRYRYILHKIIRLSIPRGARILDVGCYPPHLLTALENLGYCVSGVASLHEPITSPNISVLNIEKDRLPFRSHTFDLVLFSEVMEHLVVNPHIYLSEFHRVLSLQGRLLMTTPNAAGLHKLIPILFGRSTYFPLEQLLATTHDNGPLYHRHNREFIMDELKEVLEKSEFSTRNCEFFSGYKYQSSARTRANGNSIIRKFGRRIAYVIMDVVPRLKDSLYVEASPKKARR